MIGTSPLPLDTRKTPAPAPVLNLFAHSHRWWLLISSKAGNPLLSGLASDAVWQGSVARVPCWHPTDANAGPCACGLHAPAGAVDRARSLGSLVVGGAVRVLSVDHGEPRRPITVAAVEGPLQLLAWCAGAADGFSLERCDRTPRWIVPGIPTGAACRVHLRGAPARQRDRRISAAQFMARTAEALQRSYGVAVSMGPSDLVEPSGVAAQPRPLERRSRALHS